MSDILNECGKFCTDLSIYFLFCIVVASGCWEWYSTNKMLLEWNQSPVCGSTKNTSIKSSWCHTVSGWRTLYWKGNSHDSVTGRHDEHSIASMVVCQICKTVAKISPKDKTCRFAPGFRTYLSIISVGELAQIDCGT